MVGVVVRERDPAGAAARADRRGDGVEVRVERSIARYREAYRLLTGSEL
jgi:hypothetical protein